MQSFLWSRATAGRRESFDCWLMRAMTIVSPNRPQLPLSSALVYHLFIQGWLLSFISTPPLPFLSSSCLPSWVLLLFLPLVPLRSSLTVLLSPAIRFVPLLASTPMVNGTITGTFIYEIVKENTLNLLSSPCLRKNEIFTCTCSSCDSPLAHILFWNTIKSSMFPLKIAGI